MNKEKYGPVIELQRTWKMYADVVSVSNKRDGNLKEAIEGTNQASTVSPTLVHEHKDIVLQLLSHSIPFSFY